MWEGELGWQKSCCKRMRTIPSDFQPCAGETAQQVWDKAPSPFKAYLVILKDAKLLFHFECSLCCY